MHLNGVDAEQHGHSQVDARADDAQQHGKGGQAAQHPAAPQCGAGHLALFAHFPPGRALLRGALRRAQALTVARRVLPVCILVILVFPAVLPAASFWKKIAGNTLTYVSHGAHSDSINFTKQEGSVQVQPAIANIRIEAYAVKNGKRYLLGKDAPDAGCDYVDIEEYYDIINPSTVADALREARPEGGYTEQPYIGVGKPIVKYHMTHRILADGTVLEIMDHKILDFRSGNHGS